MKQHILLINVSDDKTDITERLIHSIREGDYVEVYGPRVLKLLRVDVNIYDRTQSTIYPVIEVNSFEEAVRKTYFVEGHVAKQHEIDEIIAEFVEKENMFICDGDELSTIFFKV